MKKLVIASGKGGVGKSMLASSLAILLAQERRVVAVDCDVDAPNLNIWLGNGKWQESKPISVTEEPIIDPEKCDGCGQCQENCQFSAIKVKNNQAKVNRFLCEGCGVCQLVCPQKAIEMKPVKNGSINQRQTEYRFPIFSGSLFPGQSGSGKIVTELRKEAEQAEGDIMVIDSAPGTGCPVIASLQGVDYACLITEPTLAGQADLSRIQELVDKFQIPFGLVINKAGINPKIARDLEKDYQGKILGRIDYDQEIFRALTKLTPIVKTDLKAKSEIRAIYVQLKPLI